MSNVLRPPLEGANMTQVTTTDLYEAVYYTLNGCQLVAIEGVPSNKEIKCQLIFEGDFIEKLQVSYLHGSALVNLMKFRRAYNQVSRWVLNARRKFEKTLKQGGQE